MKIYYHWLYLFVYLNLSQIDDLFIIFDQFVTDIATIGIF